MIKVFVSHSTQDEKLVSIIVNMLLAGLSLNKKEILCTSLPGFRLKLGADIYLRLREEIRDCEVIIGALTSNSIRSSFVLTELGAGWGLMKTIIPVLGPEFDPSDLPPMLQTTNWMRWNDVQQWQQLVEQLSEDLNVPEGQTTEFTNTLSELVTYGTPIEVAGLAKQRATSITMGELKPIHSISCKEEASLK